MFYHHEALHRSAEVMTKLREAPVTVCGAGAIGANLAETLARCGAGRLTVIDRDRVEERNLSTQPWYRTDVGNPKARILANTLFRALGTAVGAQAVELTGANVGKLLKGASLVVDAFDNSGSRQVVTDYCQRAGVPCLHVGLADGYAEVMWNEVYRVPSDAHDDVCDYPLARSLVLLAVAVATDCAVRFLATGERLSYTVTLADLSIHRYE